VIHTHECVPVYHGAQNCDTQWNTEQFW